METLQCMISEAPHDYNFKIIVDELLNFAIQCTCSCTLALTTCTVCVQDVTVCTSVLLDWSNLLAEVSLCHFHILLIFLSLLFSFIATKTFASKT